MEPVIFESNVPQSFRLKGDGKPYNLPIGCGSLYTTQDGELLHLPSSVADSLALLKLQPGELFAICRYDRPGGVPEWNVWLMPETEKARARAEVAALDLEAQLKASLKVVTGGGRTRSGKQDAPLLAPTGTEGRGPVAMPEPPTRKPAIAAVAATGSGRRRATGPIPYNVAFRELVQLVASELHAAGEQWSDQARQDAVSTLFIAAGKAGWLGVWEREDAA